MIPEKINPSRLPKTSRGLKAPRVLHRVTLNPSSANPGETLYVRIPTLSEGVVILPSTVSLVFVLTVTGHKNRVPVNNLGRNLVSRMRVTFGGETLSDTQGYDHFYTYHDLFLPKSKRGDGSLKYGISSENIRKLRSGADNKSESDLKEVGLAAIHGTKYKIPLDHPILRDHGVFYPKGLAHPLTFEITLASVSNVLVYADAVITPSYSLSNIELEYSCVTSHLLASECLSQYQVGKGFQYEHVVKNKTFTIDKANDSVINEQVNIPRRSMSGILFLFIEGYGEGSRNSEKFVNPEITSVTIDIDGVPNQLYSKGMVHPDFWESILNRFPNDHDVDQREFYKVNKFGLWIDLRTFADNEMHGGGFRLKDTQDGVKLQINRKTSGSGNITCHMFIVADAMMEIMGTNLSSILY